MSHTFVAIDAVPSLRLRPDTKSFGKPVSFSFCTGSAQWRAIQSDTTAWRADDTTRRDGWKNTTARRADDTTRRTTQQHGGRHDAM